MDHDLVRSRALSYQPQRWPSLEALLTDARGFGLETATPVQRALCRVADGQPLAELWTAPDVADAFGHAKPKPHPRELVILSGIRTGKSLLAAAIAAHASQRCDLSRLSPGERPRVSVLSLKIDTARVVYQHLVGAIRTSPWLSSLLLEEPTADSVLLRHPSGRPVEIVVVAGSRAGASVVARWSCGVVVDEAPRMVGQQDGVVNLDETRRAALGRLLPGAQIVYVGSPWAPFGPIYQLVQGHWGKPSAAVCVVRAPAPALNPVWWTPERIEALRQSPDGEQAYRTDVLGEFADLEQSALPAHLLETCVTDERPWPSPLQHYVAAMDPATRGNAWTLVLATEDPDGRRRICGGWQWQGSAAKPLRPEGVFEEIAEILQRYDVSHVETDQWAFDALDAVGARFGVRLSQQTVTAARKVELVDGLRTLVQERAIVLPRDQAMLEDLRRVQRRVTQTGVAIELPRTADGRHCDYALPIAMAATTYCPPADVPENRSRLQAELDREEQWQEELAERVRRGGDDPTGYEEEHGEYDEQEDLWS